MANLMNLEALERAKTDRSHRNYAAIFAGFAAKGINDIEPRKNVFTYNAWKALGRQVKKGEHGVKIETFIPVKRRNDDGEMETVGTRMKIATVFHVSQTEAIQ